VTTILILSFASKQCTVKIFQFDRLTRVFVFVHGNYPIVTTFESVANLENLSQSSSLKLEITSIEVWFECSYELIRTRRLRHCILVKPDSSMPVNLTNGTAMWAALFAIGYVVESF
jgi:hypothetical protein